jgi:hypothetical protein
VQRKSKDGFVLGLDVDGDAIIGSNIESDGDVFMIYLLEFLGFLGVAALLAASPLLVRTIDYLRPHLEQSSRGAKGYEPSRAHSDERAEIRNEIRRATAILEVDRRAMQRDPRS